MILKALQNHPEIKIFGELFNPNPKAFFSKKNGGFLEKIHTLVPWLTIWLRNQFPVFFLKRVVFKAASESIKAVGFKFFPYHLNKKKFYQIRKHLKGGKIIFLQRLNLLEWLVSREVAHKSGKYHASNDQDKTIETITLAPAYCQDKFERHDKMMTEIRQSLTGFDILHISYEELASDPPKILSKIQDFLGLTSQDLKITSIKQESRNMKEVIENYEELKTYFQNKQWRNFF